MSSGNWLVIIVVAAALVALANFGYQRQRESERDADSRRREEARDQSVQQRESEREARLAKEAIEREQQRASRLTTEARAVLMPELTRNSQLAKEIEDGLATGAVPLARFHTSAWDAVSGAEFVNAFQGQELARLVSVYELTKRANGSLDRLVEYTVGVASAMGNSKNAREAFRKDLGLTLERLRPELTEAVKAGTTK